MVGFKPTTLGHLTLEVMQCCECFTSISSVFKHKCNDLHLPKCCLVVMFCQCLKGVLITVPSPKGNTLTWWSTESSVSWSRFSPIASRTGITAKTLRATVIMQSGHPRRHFSATIWTQGILNNWVSGQKSCWILSTVDFISNIFILFSGYFSYCGLS